MEKEPEERSRAEEQIPDWRIKSLRGRQPLVHLLTNYVTVTDCVNALLAVGARAICSHAPMEAAQVTAGADALVCNLGGTEYYDAMLRSAGQAGKSGIPLVIDPVGCGASSYRRAMCGRLLDQYTGPLCAVRGNYAEIAALLSGHSDSPGLDSAASLCPAEETSLEQQMLAFAGKRGLVLIASGEVDLCTDGKRILALDCGTPALRRITGAGCLSSAVLAAFLALDGSLESAAEAVKLIGLSGETALERTRKTHTGAGHFHMFFLDALSQSDPIWGSSPTECCSSGSAKAR